MRGESIVIFFDLFVWRTNSVDNAKDHSPVKGDNLFESEKIGITQNESVFEMSGQVELRAFV